MSKKFLASAAVVALLSATAGSAATLNTGFSSNNGSGGNMFDVQVTGPAQTVRSVAVNISTTSSVDLFLYLRTGTFVGSENSSAGWTLHDTITLAGAGTDNPTSWDLADFTLGANSTTGFFIGSVNGSFRYTNGTSVGNQLATDGTLTVFEGIGKGTNSANRFDGSNFTTRNWNGSITYDSGSIAPVPLPAAGWLLLAALGGVAATRRKAS